MSAQAEKISGDIYAHCSEALTCSFSLSRQPPDREAICLESIYIPSGKSFKAHAHQHLIYINSLRPTSCEIRTAHAFKTFLLLANELMIIPAKTKFTIQADCACELTAIALSHELLIRNAIALWNSDKFGLTPSYPVQDLLIAHIGKSLKAELKTNSNSSAIYAKAMANALAVHLLQNFSNRSDRTAVAQRALSDKKLKRVLDYIDAHLEQKIALLDLAALIECSQYRFSHAFKQSTGFSPYQYIIQQRVEQAKRLLKRNSMNICEISIACGFSHQSHLNRHFKRIVGTTPSVFQSAF